MLKEFREFALRGNVLDMAVGIIIGAAFTTVVQSLVNDVLMPPLGMLLGGIDFSDYFLRLNWTSDQTFATLKAARDAGVPVIAYGSFINSILNFVIVAFALFMVIKQMNNIRRMADRANEKGKAAEDVPPPADVQLLAEIRDLLKAERPSARGTPAE